MNSNLYFRDALRSCLSVGIAAKPSVHISRTRDCRQPIGRHSTRGKKTPVSHRLESGQQEDNLTTTETTAPALTDENRKALLANKVTYMVRSGWRVDSQGDYQATFSKGKRPNHILHLILTILTVGLWGIVWIILAITKHEKRKVITVDPYGNFR